MNASGHGGAPVINLTGDLVMLGPMEPEHIDAYQLWMNDFETLRLQSEPLPMPGTIAGITRWYESYVLAAEDVAWFTVFDGASQAPIGWTELKDIDHHHGTAEFAIMIGAPDARGKGYGTETARLMLSYGFAVLGLNNIYLTCLEFNVAAQRAYEKAGFREFGRRTEAHFSGGRRWDVVLMQCLSREFGDGHRGAAR